jgi:glycerol-3-phosphate dehydrogenase
MEWDALIIGGGGAGLWLLDEMVRGGLNVLLVERDALGGGQTVSSQGIIHGGIKYTLSGSLTESARAIREMPGLWRACLSGSREPNLSTVRVLAERCHLWRTRSLKSKLSMVGARAGLRSAAVKIEKKDRPPALAYCPGDVFAVDEQVIDTVAFAARFAEAHAARCLRVRSEGGVRLSRGDSGNVCAVELMHPDRDERLRVQPRYVVLTAGEGNAALRGSAGLSEEVMQRRPLHMVMVRGALPELFGHCVDGAKTRATITSATDAEGRTVWHVGGQISEDGVGMSPSELIAHARRELSDVLPGVPFVDAQWATYRIDRAEARTQTGIRPGGPVIRTEGNVITAWPTKLALVPELARMIMQHVTPRDSGKTRGTGLQPVEVTGCKPVPHGGSSESAGDSSIPIDWPRPPVARPPWERCTSWQ